MPPIALRLRRLAHSDSRSTLSAALRGPLLALAVASGCGPSAEAREAERVGRAIDTLRDAPNDPVDLRRGLLEQLEREPANGALARAARDACATAYRPMLEAQELEAKVRAAIAKDPDVGDPMIAADLALAETRLKESKTAMAGCDQAVAALKRVFH